MFSIIKGAVGKLGLRWFEWVFIGLLLTTMTIGYLLYQKVGALKGDLAKAEVVLLQNENKQDHLNEIIELDREVNHTFFNDQMAAVRQQYENRGQVLDKYLKLKSVTVPEPSEKVVEVNIPKPDNNDPPNRQPKQQPNPEPIEDMPHETQDPTPDDLDSLKHLVDSMQHVYCRAEPDGDNCPTTSTSG